MSTGTAALLRDAVALDADRWRPARLSLTLSRAVLATLLVGFAVAHAAGVRLPPKAQYVVYLVGMVALNLPHGGYEHFDNLKSRGLAFGWRYVAVYLAMIAAFVGLLFVAPVIGLALAISVAMVKGGNGGLHVLDATAGTPHLRSRFQRVLAIAVRGGAVMAVPIVFWPGTFHTFSAYMVNIFDPGALDPLARYFSVTRPLIGAGYALAAVTHVGLGFVRARGVDDGAGAAAGEPLTAWLVDAGETALLVGYFAVVPVVVAVGLYFPFWYSVRQVARTTAVGGDDGDTAEGLFGFESPGLVALAAWVVLILGAVATFSLLAAVYYLVPNPLGNAPPLAGAVAFWSIFISVIALPHVVVGSWYDRARGIWYVPTA
jgi:Brp/Blh family beta-carotene 15,15'-monooxygenase